MFSIPSVYIRSSAPVDYYYYYYYYYLEKGEMIFISLEFSNRCSCSTTLPLSTRGLSLHPPFLSFDGKELNKTHTHNNEGRYLIFWVEVGDVIFHEPQLSTFRPCTSLSVVIIPPTIFSWKGKWPNDRRSTPSDLLFFLKYIPTPRLIMKTFFFFSSPTGVVC